MKFDSHAYSEHGSLTTFLDSLSYHSVGAPKLVGEISKLGEPCDTLVDVGCGNGHFTATLLKALEEHAIDLPKRIVAIEPDHDNLREYTRRVQGFFPLIDIEPHEIQIQAFAPEPKAQIVLCSHSLYEPFETPHLKQDEKMKVLERILHMKASNGIFILTLASRESIAYRAKADILKRVGEPDFSVFGEDLYRLLLKMSCNIQFENVNSYMDMKRVLDAETPCDVADWARYFCRLQPDIVTETISSSIREILMQHGSLISALPCNLQRTFLDQFSELGPPTQDSFVLPHKEVFLTVT